MARTASTESMRYERTATRNGDNVHPTTRWIVGRLDRQIGAYKTCAPTTSWVAVQIVVTTAVSQNMFREAFDVNAAFLSEMPIEKSIHIGHSGVECPAVGQFANKRPGQILQIYALTEAPMSSRASDKTSGVDRVEVRWCGVGETRRRKKTKGDSDPARGRWLIVW